MSAPVVAGAVEAARSGAARRLLGGLLGTVIGLCLLVMLPLVLVGAVVGNAEQACLQSAAPGAGVQFPPGSGSWTATSYGPPWTDGNGSGETATGIDLRPARPAYLIAVDPSVIPLHSWVHVRPNPFGDPSIAFYAGDTGSKIIGKHIDIYDWRGRTFQNNWGVRSVDVTPAQAPGAGNLLDQLAPPSLASAPIATPAECAALTTPAGPLQLTPGERAHILPDGSATAPRSAPSAIKRFIAGANAIHTKPYSYGGGHGASLDTIQSDYDCSSSTSFALHRAGMLAAVPRDSTTLESWGVPGPGRWLTLYANSGHVFTIVAGISFNTAHYGTTTPPGSGPRWSYDTTGQLAYDPHFVVRHWPHM